MVYWAGVYHLSTNDSSEELGSLTYGTTLGEAAQTGNSSLGLGVNYTSSSNVDDLCAKHSLLRISIGACLTFKTAPKPAP